MVSAEQPVPTALLYRELRAQLNEAGVEDAGFETETLFRHVTGHSRFERDTVPPRQAQALRALARQRTERVPLQYLLGRWPFLGLELEVGPGVLVPRPETEQVCLAAVERLSGMSAPVVVDLCAGTGALALGLQWRLPQAVVTAVELDTAAMPYLLRNIEAFAAAHPRAPHPVQADVFTYHGRLAPALLDLIVSNPPYVSEAEYATLAPELFHEPRQALVPGADALAFYRAIAVNYAAALKPGGHLVFEIGATQGSAVTDILRESGYLGVEIRPDYAGHPRIALAHKPC